MFKKMLLLMVVALLSVSGPVFATFHFWTGAVSTDPTDAGNWDNGTDTPTLPGKGDVAAVGINSSWEAIVVTDNPILTSEYGDPNGAGWWIMWGQAGQNGLTVDDGAYMVWSKNDCNLRNGAYLKVTGCNSDGGPSLVIPPTFRIGQQGNDVDNYANATSTITVEDDGYLRIDPSVAVDGDGGSGILIGGEINALIEIRDDGILELVSGTGIEGSIVVPQFAFGTSDPAKNKVVINDNGQLLLAGDPPTGLVEDVETSLEDMIAMGLITSDTGIVVSGSNPTVVTAVASPLTIVDLPAVGTDAAIGIDASKTYTHAIDFGTNAPAVINGVAFDQGPTENIRELYVGVSSQGYGYIIDDTRAPDVVKINPHGGGDASNQADGDSLEMLKDMIYYSSAEPNEGIILTLQDLVPGTEYSVRWYYRAWDPELPRPITVIADDGESIDIDIDEKAAAYLDYTFVADDNDVTITFICNDDNQGPHLYGITCEEVPPQAQDPGTEGLLAYYPLDGDATDASGNGRDGIIMGDPSFVDGVVGQAIDLDGDGDYVDCGNDPNFSMEETSALTVSTWVTIRSVAHTWAALVAKGEHAWRVGVAGNDPIYHMGIAWGSGSDPRFFDGVTAVGYDEWHHVAAVFDGATMMIYLDGALDNSVPTTEALEISDANVLIGTNPDELGRYWDGLIDEVFIYNRALTEDEIAFLAQ